MTRRDNALILLSGIVGALMLSRAMSDSALSDRTLLATRRFLTEVFASTDESRNAKPGAETTGFLLKEISRGWPLGHAASQSHES